MAIQEDELQALIANNTSVNDITQEILAQQQHSKESLDSTSDSVNQILTAQNQIVAVKKSLGDIIDSITQNQSMVTRASQWWGGMPLWQKTMGGLIVTVPTFAVGIAADITLLLAISGFTGVTYSLSGIVLDDHYRCNEDIARRLKQGIFSLADVLQLTVEALAEIHKRLSAEIIRFKEQNLQFESQLSYLRETVQTLTQQVDKFQELECSLAVQQANLEQKVYELENSLGGQDELLSQTQKELAKVKQDYEKNDILLSNVMADLQGVGQQMGVKLKQAEEDEAKLKDTLTHFTQIMLEDEKNSKDYQQQLENLLTEKKSEFNKLTTGFSQAKEHIVTVKEELQKGCTRKRELFELHGHEFARLEQILISLADQNNNEVKKQSSKATPRFFNLPAVGNIGEQLLPSTLIFS